MWQTGNRLNFFCEFTKDGRKYGIDLLIVLQGPVELNISIMYQCGNSISLRVTNDQNKSAVATMFIDSLVRIVEMFPDLSTSICIVVGDIIMLLPKIIFDKLKEKNKSTTIDLCDKWYNGK